MVSVILYYLFNIAFLFFTIRMGFFAGEKKKAVFIQSLFILFIGLPIFLAGVLFFITDKFEDWYYARRNNKRN